MAENAPDGTSRGYDILAFSLPVPLVFGFVAISIGMPVWSVLLAFVAIALGVVSALGSAKLSRQVPRWLSNAGMAVAILVATLTATLPTQVMLAPLTFCGAFVCAALLARRRQLRREGSSLRGHS